MQDVDQEGQHRLMKTKHEHKFQQAVYSEVVDSSIKRSVVKKEYRNYIFCECGQIIELY